MTRIARTFQRQQPPLDRADVGVDEGAAVHAVSGPVERQEIVVQQPEPRFGRERQRGGLRRGFRLRRRAGGFSRPQQKRSGGRERVMEASSVPQGERGGFPRFGVDAFERGEGFRQRDFGLCGRRLGRVDQKIDDAVVADSPRGADGSGAGDGEDAAKRQRVGQLRQRFEPGRGFGRSRFSVDQERMSFPAAPDRPGNFRSSSSTAAGKFTVSGRMTCR